VAAKTVTGDEAPAQEVIIDRLETMNLEPDVWEPSADNPSQTTKDTLRLPRTKHTGTKGVQTLPLASKVAMVRPWRSAATST